MLDGHLFVHMTGVIKSFYAYSVPETSENYLKWSKQLVTVVQYMVLHIIQHKWK